MLINELTEDLHSRSILAWNQCFGGGSFSLDSPTLSHSEADFLVGYQGVEQMGQSA